MRATFAISTLLFAAVGLVQARDDRELFTIPSTTTMDAFTKAFTTECNTWAPALGAGLVQASDLVELGDFQGKNTDTEVRLVCSYWDGSDPSTIELFTEDIAEGLGATLDL
ncbi:hypothetical protein FB45DRAFT_43856 [Roridomyces roridus]|uniref:Uncharacterized protein n=1 Tax=Roridomyces roridus TaxID=1738132 RepID=A0AAD7BRM4_9AGAR|nr:hypothetical protein FB45DRAFT_43856 [Roridomyces roridus]